jgi:hypothetical protein
VDAWLFLAAMTDASVTRVVLEALAKLSAVVRRHSWVG